jgi:HK97 family phage major capsid protein
LPVALVDFTAEYDGGTVEIRKGIDHVSDDHELFRRFPARFGVSGSARSGDRTRSREDFSMNETEMIELDRRERGGEELEPEEVRQLREWRNKRSREERQEWLRERASSGHTEAGASFRGDDRRRNHNVPQHVAEAHDRGLHAIERYSAVDVLTPRAADRLDDVIRDRDPLGLGARYLAAVGDLDYTNAFGKILADPTHGALRFSPREREAFDRVNGVMHERALVEGTGSAGGFAVPFALDPSIIQTSNGALNPIRQLARVETITTDIWKGVASDGVVASYDAEAAEVSDDSPTLVQPSLDTERLTIFVPFSIELGQDWGSLQQELLRLMTDAKDVLEATKFLTGAGHASNEPTGILSIGVAGGLTTTQRVQTAGAGAFVLADVYTFKQALPARFIPNASFTWHPNRLDAIYRFVAAGSTTEPQIMPDGRGGPLLGKPTYEWSTMATVLTTGTKIGLYGDFKTGYRIVDRIGMQVELVPHLFGAAFRPTGQRGLYAIARNSGGVVAPNALRYLETL